MGKYRNILYIALACSLVAACDADGVRDVDFDVSLKNSPDRIYAGDEVTFDFSGDADYVVFWSGEDGHSYGNRERTKVPVQTLEMTYSIMEQYSRPATSQMLTIMVSENFGGSYTKEGIESADWTVLSQNDAEMDWWVPSGNVKPAVESGGDLSAYKDRNFTLAFRYATQDGPLAEDTQHPRIDISPMALKKVADGVEVTQKNPQDDFGFRMVVLEGEKGNTNVNATTLLFQPASAQKNIDIWCISQPMDPSKVSPDKGEPVRTLTMPVKSFAYVFEESGTYTVTFVARNANAWNMNEAVRTMTVEVMDR
ncbi:MAG: DUF5017 domain-containing protein [Clostridium sp.]|nr:DUF5017 domain-containing protein [Bacteroides sp.]MCM1197957.1 DUF5017 domain-containing protein [Clostridium sp.]